ncbi:GNAT family N-acetyltransferase [Nocardioides sp. GY 10127]|uniref:GNAT family N-acetyltransferase n=1 Tax=Nocardioides sp. GY 10127 TaxID=2569762 RepID=UPI0010A8591A|nr:GNAT family N-acetyltransferase [Nocardioides sp. GY 10127]TIC86475.1 GNAT family N-acetyltransferase [Nocardioides sp. GY 10127]
MLSLSRFPDADLPRWREIVTERRFRLRELAFTGEPELFAPVADARTRAALEVLLPDGGPGPQQALHLVSDDGFPIGWVWLTRLSRERLGLVDASLVTPDRTADLRDLVERTAAADGVTEMELVLVPGDDTHAAWRAAGPAHLASQRRVLPLPEPRGASDATAGAAGADVRLRAMTEPEFDSFFARSSREYVESRRASDPTRDPGEVQQEAESQLRALLPGGRATQGQSFWTVLADDAPAAELWVAVEPPGAFVYEIRVDESHRGRGVGRAAMRAAAQWCTEQGLSALGLNVFGDNVVARGLYESLGYVLVEESLTVTLTRL